jgi:hypothetical protein
LPGVDGSRLFHTRLGFDWSIGRGVDVVLGSRRLFGRGLFRLGSLVDVRLVDGWPNVDTGLVGTGDRR